jgi:2-polyprenyl-3-methyl-5-hydroxy-6-metoxy-1,4-benzoquinol methylase
MQDQISCNVCKSKVISHFMNKDNWELMSCNSCGLVFLKNVPSNDELKTIYNDEYFTDGQKSPLDDHNIEANPTYLNSKKRIKFIKKFGINSGKLLDVGCSTGVFAKVASKDFEVEGIDVSEYAVKYAQEHLNIKAQIGTVFNAKLNKNIYDIITMWDVIEHVTNANAYIKRISELIKPNGLFVLSTGDINTTMFKIQRENWHLLTPPQHIYFFNPQNISVLLEEHGFKVIKILYKGQYTNVGYIFNKLKNMYSDRRILARIFAFLSTSFIRKCNIYLNLFDVMTVYAIPNNTKSE